MQHVPHTNAGRRGMNTPPPTSPMHRRSRLSTAPITNNEKQRQCRQNHVGIGNPGEYNGGGQGWYYDPNNGVSHVMLLTPACRPPNTDTSRRALLVGVGDTVDLDFAGLDDMMGTVPDDQIDRPMGWHNTFDLPMPPIVAAQLTNNAGQQLDGA